MKKNKMIIDSLPKNDLSIYTALIGTYICRMSNIDKLELEIQTDTRESKLYLENIQSNSTKSLNELEKHIKAEIGEPKYITITPKTKDIQFFLKANSELTKNVKINLEEKESNILLSIKSDDESQLINADEFILSLKSMIKQVDENSFLKFSEVDILTKKQEEKLDSFNDTKQEYNKEETVVSMFSEVVKKYPENIAVVYKDRKYTYREVDEISNKIARYIVSKGIAKEDVVGVLIPRSEYMPIISLGVIKANAAYEPLDPSYPKDRLNFMINDAKVKLIIAEEKLQGLIEYDGEILLTKEINQLSERENVKLSKPSTKDLFVLLYTSGSTGTPKGVMLTHRNVVAFCEWNRKNYELNENSRVCAYASYGFDANIMDTYPTLTTGASLYVVHDEIRLDMFMLNDYFEKNGITHSLMTTQIGRMFASNIDNKSLKHLSVGGEKLASIKPPKYKLHNAYGPTESTVMVTSFIVDKEYDNIPIGKAVGNMKLYVVDKFMNRLPIKGIGELCVSGPQVARGYLNQEELTKKAFVENPFDKSKGEAYELMYKTGDVVRYLEDGNIEYVGREDGQVKIRGFRIELTEVETVIRKYKGIEDVTVQAFEEKDGSKYIVAYIVSKEKIEVDRLNDFIKSEKPPYMVPTATIQIDKIPLNTNQKVDKKALPKAKNQESVSNNNIENPTNETQKKLCKIYEDVLGMKPIGINDSFFDCGGTSILAAKVAMKCMSEKIQVVYADIFNCKTVKELDKVSNEKTSNNDTKRDINLKEKENNNIISEALKYNTIQYVDETTSTDFKDVLLLGATGFLGIHVLNNLITEYDCKIYCLVRKGKSSTVESRLKTLLMYYFNNTYSDLFNKRIFVIDGDATNKECISKVFERDFDVVFNCSASVKHFSKDDSMKKINVDTVKYLCEMCKKTNRKLIHISTRSVAGLNVKNKFPEDRLMAENELFFGQEIKSNIYISTKFNAEKIILEEVEKGLKAKICRVGNLMSRFSDGEFQINFKTNAFMSSIKGYVSIGKIPVSILDEKVEFSPIDYTARAVTTIAKSNDKFTVFHLFNNRTVDMADVVEALKDNGIKIDIVSDKEYAKAFELAMKDDNKMLNISGLITELGQDAKEINSENIFSTKVLYRLGYKWCLISKEYLYNVISALNTLAFFDD